MPTQLSDRTASGSNILKEQVVPDIQKNYYRMGQFPFLRLLGMESNENNQGSGSPIRPRVKRVKKLSAKYDFEVRHKTDLFGGGIQAANEGEALLQGRYYSAESKAYAKFIQGSFSPTLQLIITTQDDKKSLAREITENSFGAAKRMLQEKNRMIVSHGNGILAYVNGAVTADTAVTLQSTTAGTNEIVPTRFISPGDKLRIGTVAQVEADGGDVVTVASVDSDTAITLTANATLADEDVVVRSAAWDDTNSLYKEITGLYNLLGETTATVQNVDRSSGNAWFVPRNTNISGNISLAKLTTEHMACRSYAEDASALIWIMNPITWQRVAGLMTTTKEYDPTNYGGNLAGGTMGLTFYSPDGSVPLLLDDFVPDGVAYLIDPNGFMWGEMAPFMFAPDALMMEGVSGQRLGGYLNYEFAFVEMGNLALLNAKSSARIYGITGPAIS